MFIGTTFSNYPLIKIYQNMTKNFNFEVTGKLNYRKITQTTKKRKKKKKKIQIYNQKIKKLNPKEPN